LNKGGADMLLSTLSAFKVILEAAVCGGGAFGLAVALMAAAAAIRTAGRAWTLSKEVALVSRPPWDLRRARRSFVCALCTLVYETPTDACGPR